MIGDNLDLGPACRAYAAALDAYIDATKRWHRALAADFAAAKEMRAAGAAAEKEQTWLEFAVGTGQEEMPPPEWDLVKEAAVDQLRAGYEQVQKLIQNWVTHG